jgi:hypothetical protein
MSKQPTKRNIRKTILRRFEEQFDLRRLDYSYRSKPAKDMAKIMGALFAGVIYLAGFGLAYYSWTKHNIDVNLLNKFAFIFMIPASVVGMFAYLLTSSRREFPIREDMRAHLSAVEGSDGALWRYEPLLKQMSLKKIDIEGLIEASREGRLIKMAPEDICATLHALHQNLSNASVLTNAETLEAIEENFAGRAEAA